MIDGIGTTVDIGSSVKVKKADGTYGAIDVSTLRASIKPIEASKEEKKRIASPANAGALGLKVDTEKMFVMDFTLLDGAQKVQETTGKVSFRVALPENAGLDFNSEVAVVRIHDGAAEILETKKDASDNHVYSFETDRFSTYAFVNVAKGAKTVAISPKTGHDFSMIYVIAALAAVAGIAAAVCVRRKKA